ncbi:MAG: phenylalanine--tRNA ligase subunit alpha, partial [Flavisolibacter sp.]|nr:phenylalanine--tRNA ligase subunit alpha [Flavisolibacter sp.]
MEPLLQQIEQYKKEIEALNGTDINGAETFRIKYLGSKGIIKTIMSEMKNVPAKQRKEFGQAVNEFKRLAEEKYEQLKATTTNDQQATTSDIDLSLPGDPISVGSRHPINLVRKRIIDIFHHLGFAVADGPEIEDDWHNFTALNLPENHPARDMQDTFYIHQNPDWLLRTHTSNVQIREMEKGVLPIRIICPGRVYRNETISARAHCFFHQVEGLYIDEQVSFAD